MAIAANKRSIMTLYSSQHDLFSHQARIVLAEKGVTFDVIDTTAEGYSSKDFMQINPRGTTPTLVDRDLVLTEPRIILEYLDERFPHPPLLPVYPVARAKSRLMISRIEREWYSLLHQVESGTADAAKKARKALHDQIASIDTLFANSAYFLSEEFSLLDCCLAPLLWRLPKLDLDLPARAKEIKTYAERVFTRPSFKTSVVA